MSRIVTLSERVIVKDLSGYWEYTERQEKDEVDQKET